MSDIDIDIILESITNNLQSIISSFRELGVQFQNNSIAYANLSAENDRLKGVIDDLEETIQALKGKEI